MHRRDKLAGGIERSRVKITDHRHRRSLRPCHLRPRRCRATEKADELASPDVVCHPIFQRMVPGDPGEERRVALSDQPVCDLLHPKWCKMLHLLSAGLGPSRQSINVRYDGLWSKFCRPDRRIPARALSTSAFLSHINGLQTK